MTETTGRRPLRWRGGALIVLFAATAALTGGTQELAPAPAAAMMQEGEECMLDWSYLVDCEEQNGGGGGDGGGGIATGDTAGDDDATADDNGPIDVGDGQTAVEATDGPADSAAHMDVPDHNSIEAELRIDRRNCHRFGRQEARIRARIRRHGGFIGWRDEKALEEIRTDWWPRYNCEAVLGVSSD